MVALSLSNEDFAALHKAADGKGKKCSVSKRMLSALLLDHGKLISKLRDERREVETMP